MENSISVGPTFTGHFLVELLTLLSNQAVAKVNQNLSGSYLALVTSQVCFWFQKENKNK